MDTKVDSLPWLLWTTFHWTWEWSYVFDILISFPLAIYPIVALWDHIIEISETCSGTTTRNYITDVTIFHTFYNLLIIQNLMYLGVEEILAHWFLLAVTVVFRDHVFTALCTFQRKLFLAIWIHNYSKELCGLK